MKKTLLASAIAATLAAGSAQAVTLYDANGTTFSSYGRLQLELQNFDGDNKIQNNGTRLGFAGTQALDNGLEGFVNMEFRYNAGVEADTMGTVRNSFLGVRGNFGEVKAGNFDSLAYTFVSSNADVMENEGWRSLDDGSNNARGFTAAYQTPDLNGLTLAIAAKHFTDGKTSGGYPADGADGETWNIQVAGAYTLTDSLTLAFAFDQNNEDGQPANTVFGIEDDYRALYEAESLFTVGLVYSADALTLGALVEVQGDLLAYGVAGAYNYGAGSIYGVVTVVDIDGDFAFQEYDSTNKEWVDDGSAKVSESGTQFGLGVNYNLADNFYVYGEYAYGEDKTPTSFGDVSVVTVGARYAW